MKINDDDDDEFSDDTDIYAFIEKIVVTENILTATFWGKSLCFIYFLFLWLIAGAHLVELRVILYTYG